MRQIFSSARLENVEGVAALLNQHGIETWISEGRSYKGGRRRVFSYRANDKEAATPPAVWIVHSEDQTPARALLREAGLIETTRDSYLPDAIPEPVRRPVNHAARIRVALLATVVILAAITTARGCHRPAPDAEPPAAPAPAVPQEAEPDGHIVPVETSLR